jgi:hypothetical protein
VGYRDAIMRCEIQGRCIGWAAKCELKLSLISESSSCRINRRIRGADNKSCVLSLISERGTGSKALPGQKHMETMQRLVVTATATSGARDLGVLQLRRWLASSGTGLLSRAADAVKFTTTFDRPRDSAAAADRTLLTPRRMA